MSITVGRIRELLAEFPDGVTLNLFIDTPTVNLYGYVTGCQQSMAKEIKEFHLDQFGKPVLVFAGRPD